MFSYRLACCIPRNCTSLGLNLPPQLIEKVSEAVTEMAIPDISQNICQVILMPHRRGTVGHPRLHIPTEDLEWFVDCGYSAIDIAQTFGVHPNAVRERPEHQLGRPHGYSNLSDHELDELIQKILVQIQAIE